MHASPSIIKKAFKQKSKRELIEIIMYFLSVYQDPEIKKLVKKRMSREARDDQKNPA